MSDHVDSPSIPSLIPIKAWPHPWPSQAAWRHLISHSGSNGLDDLGVIYRIGTKSKRRRILIHEERFYLWCDQAGLEPQSRDGAQVPVPARSANSRP